MKDIFDGCVEFCLGLLVVLLCIGGIVIFMAGLIGFINYVDSIKCQQYAEATKREVNFKFWPNGSCYVKTDSGWFLKSQVNQNNFKESINE